MPNSIPVKSCIISFVQALVENGASQREQRIPNLCSEKEYHILGNLCTKNFIVVEDYKVKENNFWLKFFAYKLTVVSNCGILHCVKHVKCIC